MDDGVDVLARDDLADDGVADVGADELGVTDVMGRRDDVNPDDMSDTAGARQGSSDSTAEIAGDSGEENDVCHGPKPTAANRSDSCARPRHLGGHGLCYA